MLGWELPPHNSGGLGVACYQLCKALAKLDIDIEFILPYDANYSPDFMKVTVASSLTATEINQLGNIYEGSSKIGKHGVGMSLDSLERLYTESVGTIVDQGDFNVIHAHDWLTFRAALKAKMHSGLPLIVHLHSIESDRSGNLHGNPMVEEIEYLGLSSADRIIAVSQHTKDSIVKSYGIPSDKIEIVHNGLDPSELIPLDNTTSYPYLKTLAASGYNIVANVGRLTIQKNLTNLLRAAREVIARLPKTIFLIVGDGDQYTELIELAANLGISKNVIFTGFQRGKHWRDSFAIADIFAMPSQSEPFGLTPLEASFYGTPSLISRQSGVGEILKNCLKVDFWDVNEMANQLVTALQNRNLRQELSTNASLELDNLTWSKSADKLSEIYTSSMSSRS